MDDGAEAPDGGVESLSIVTYRTGFPSTFQRNCPIPTILSIRARRVRATFAFACAVVEPIRTFNPAKVRTISEITTTRF